VTLRTGDGQPQAKMPKLNVDVAAVKQEAMDPAVSHTLE
jgi:hypothetical protein